ncbi:MAG: hypothetical protein AMJ62_01140 [Myxococcales bacterium SG8_38]|nr:MAG: hypothetical protein AMJ62_01140 [Myxococcales bacterium SG8_38]
MVPFAERLDERNPCHCLFRHLAAIAGGSFLFFRGKDPAFKKRWYRPVAIVGTSRFRPRHPSPRNQRPYP